MDKSKMSVTNKKKKLCHAISFNFNWIEVNNFSYFTGKCIMSSGYHKINLTSNYHYFWKVSNLFNGIITFFNLRICYRN